MTLTHRIQAMSALGTWMSQPDEKLQEAILKSSHHNPWFTLENSNKALQAIAAQFLSSEKLHDWIKHYDVPEQTEPKTVGLVMAGNIPLVGFHDLLSVFITGHISLIKLSDKDAFLLPCLLEWLYLHYPETKNLIQVSERLQGFDAVIATGSNNSARYFEAYFGKYPHIIRKNRTSVAVLDGNETEADLIRLGKDVFSYFGLGCRNVSKIYLPEGYDPDHLLSAWQIYEDIIQHDKYKNNFDYNYALALLNQQPHFSNGHILLTENKDLHSRIAGLHFEYNADTAQLARELSTLSADIQCIVSGHPVSGQEIIGFGETQAPGLFDYADGIDTVLFLKTLILQ